MRIFRDRGFAIDNAGLFLSMIAFVPLFFFASMYAQISLGESASNAGLYLLIFFAGFATAAQVGGRILDKVGARPAVVVGCLLGAIGFALWARELPDLSIGQQWPYIVVAGAGIGLLLGPANTDAINCAPRTSYGEATGITQTVRNFGSSLGLAVLGTILINSNRSHIESTLGAEGIPKSTADEIAHAVTQSGGGDSGRFTEKAGARAREIFDAIQVDFAYASRAAFYVMAGALAVAFVVALVGAPRGRVEEVVDAPPGAAG